MNNLAVQNLNATLKILFILVLMSFVSLFAIAQSGHSAGVAHSSDVQTYTQSVLYAFPGAPDGISPNVGLVRDSSGKLYGGTEFGGQYGLGSVFELTPNGSCGYAYRQIYSLTGGVGGALLQGLTIDTQGNLYGWTSTGGLGYSNGDVFELSPGSDGNWVMSNAYAFTDTSDGRAPTSIVVDSAGNVYGTTNNSDGSIQSYYGAVFELTTIDGQWYEQTLYGFSFSERIGKYAGEYPRTLVIGKNGDLYGTTNLGGTLPDKTFGSGTVFKLHNTANKGWLLTTLHTFGGPNDAGWPRGNLVFDAAGNIYGNAAYGTYPNFVSGIYELTRSGQITWIYIPGDAYENVAPGFAFDKAGNLYFPGGGDVFNQYCTPPSGCGAYFKLTPPAGGQSTAWTKNVLFSFDDGADGGMPVGPAVLDDAGNLYSTAQYGGLDWGGDGVVFKLSPDPVATATAITKDNPSSSKTGQTVVVAFSVAQTVAGINKPTGIVTVRASTGEACMAAIPANGKASCKLAFMSAGPRTLTATYSGDVGNLSSVSTDVAQTVTSVTRTTLTKPNPAKEGHPVTVHFAVEARDATKQTRPTGAVTVNADTGENCTGSLFPSGKGKCQIVFDSPGSRKLVATYPGDADNEPSVSAARTETVN